MEGRHFTPTKTVVSTFSLSPDLVAITLQVTTAATGIFAQPPAMQLQPDPKQS